jgi:phosphate starvation-inducible PhoH-like protein
MAMAEAMHAVDYQQDAKMSQQKKQRQVTSSAPKKIRIDDLKVIDALTDNQTVARESWSDGDHLVLNGSAGTGKTFTALYLALQDVLDKSTPWENIHLIRSIVPTREMGFLPGTAEEKLLPFVTPYISLCEDLFTFKGAYHQLIEQEVINFHSTSFIRGQTFDNSIIIVDEMQNLTFHELDSVITRLGVDSRIILCGDYYQSDFVKNADKNGLQDFLKILELMKNFTTVEFGWQDIVRSDFVRDYIMTKEMMMENKLR